MKSKNKHKFSESIKNKLDKHFSLNGVEVFVKDSPPKNVSIRKTVKALMGKIPSHLLSNLDIVYVGQFEDLKKKNFQAMYKDSAIYVSNELKSDSDLLDDLVHEVAHSVEEQYESLIYSDRKIEKEFINKRKQLWQILKDEGYSVELSAFLNTRYDQSFDQMLYLEIGYPILGIYTKNLFYSPYGCTSLREYFANGFEAFFMREEVFRLKKLSPVLYDRIVKLLQLKDNER